MPPTRSTTGTGTSSEMQDLNQTRTRSTTGTSFEMEDRRNEVKKKFEETLRRLAMEVEQQNLSKTIPQEDFLRASSLIRAAIDDKLENAMDMVNYTQELSENAMDKVNYTQELSENAMDKSKIMPAISSIEDFLQVFHESSLDIIKKSVKRGIAKFKNKEAKSYLEEIHEKTMDNHERCHEERMTVIKKLPKRIVSLLKYNPKGLVQALTEDTIANDMILKEEIVAECGDPWLATEDEKKERHWRLRAFLRQVSVEAHVVSECPYGLRTRKRIKSVEDLLVEGHERLMAFNEKSFKKVISNARKKGEVLLQMVSVMGHEDRMAMLERDHEERMEMIQKLPKMILSKLENKIEGLRMAIDKDIIDHLERHSKEIIVKSRKMLEAECACRNIS